MLKDATAPEVIGAIRALAYHRKYREIVCVLKSRPLLLSLRDEYRLHNESVFWSYESVWALCEGDWFYNAPESDWVSMVSNVAVNGSPEALVTILYHPRSHADTNDACSLITSIVRHVEDMYSEFAPAQAVSQTIQTRCATLLTNIRILKTRLAIVLKTSACV